MSCSNTVQISQGNSFACVFTWTPGATGPANLLTTTLSSTFRDRDGKDHALTVVKSIDGLSFTVSYPGDTADWMLGLGRWDIRFAFPTGVSHSDVFRVNVIESVTA